MKLPNGEDAIVDLRKLEEYCLSPHHPRGRNKARVFASAGIHLDSAEALREALLWAAKSCDAKSGGTSAYGERYVVDLDWAAPGRVVKIRSTWIVRVDEGKPRLTSCYVL
ncbi:MAG TPA: hypothetical protein VH639_14860 [Bryobacteraceae bacterium]